MANWGLICDPCPGNSPTCDGIYVQIPGYLSSNNRGFACHDFGVCATIEICRGTIEERLAFVVRLEKQAGPVFPPSFLLYRGLWRWVGGGVRGGADVILSWRVINNHTGNHCHRSEEMHRLCLSNENRFDIGRGFGFCCSVDKHMCLLRMFSHQVYTGSTYELEMLL